MHIINIIHHGKCVRMVFTHSLVCIRIQLNSVESGFKIAGLNINSLTKHIDELRIFLTDCSIDILSIKETKLDDSITSCEVQIPGYEFIRHDRNRQGGGVGFYIKTSINFTVRFDLNVLNLENLCIEIRKSNSRPFLMATW